MLDKGKELINISRVSNITNNSRSFFRNENEEVVFNYQVTDQSVLSQSLNSKIELFLSLKTTTCLLTVLTVIYTTLVVIRIAFETETSSVNLELDIIELIFLSAFVLEILLKIYSIRRLFFKNYWNLIDAAIISVCLIVIIGGLSNSQLSNNQAFKLGKVLRIFRLFLMFRKMNSISKFKSRLQRKKSTVVNVSSPSEKIIEILSSILNSEWISYQTILKQDIEWCIHVIKEHKIYQTNVRTSKEDLKEIVGWAVNQSIYDEEDITSKSLNITKVLSFSKISPEVDLILSDCHRLDFDIFALEEVDGRPLENIISHLFALYNLYHILNIDSGRLQGFIKEIESGYHKTIYYHNSTHAADVVQSYYYFLSTCQAISVCSLSDLDISISLISSAIHDYDHPGYNNLFLINTSNPLSITYNDRSVLENHHVASAFKLISDEKYNFLENLAKDEKKKFRAKVISLVLATDFAKHFIDLSKFQLKFSGSTVRDDEDKLLVMEMMIHACDIGNPTRPWALSFEWATRVMNEFFCQGDREREMGIPISNLCDRFTVNIAKAQIGFCELFVEPTFKAIELVLSGVRENIRNAIENKKRWKEEMEKDE